MIDNEYAYDIPQKVLDLINVDDVYHLATLRSEESFTYIPAAQNEYLQHLNASVFDGHLCGVSLFVLKNKADVDRAHIDMNILRPETSRQCSMNFPLQCLVAAEWYTDREPITVYHPTYAEYALRYFPVKDNDVVFEHVSEDPYLCNTNIPHLGYSVPVGGLLVSLGFGPTFEEMKALLQAL